GGGGLMSLSQTIIGDVVPPRERGRYQAYFAAMFFTASIVGPILGGVASQYMHWSVIFWINLPIGAVALYVAGTVLKRLPRMERPHRIDYPGAILMVVASVSLLLAVSWGGKTYGWTSPQILILALVALVAGALFAWRLARAPEPFIPLELLRNRVVLCCVISAFFSMGALIAMTLYMPVYFELVLGFSSSQSGLALLALSAGMVVGPLGTGLLLGHLRRYKRPSELGVAAAIVGTLV